MITISFAIKCLVIVCLIVLLVVVLICSLQSLMPIVIYRILLSIKYFDKFYDIPGSLITQKRPSDIDIELDCHMNKFKVLAPEVKFIVLATRGQKCPAQWQLKVRRRKAGS